MALLVAYDDRFVQNIKRPSHCEAGAVVFMRYADEGALLVHFLEGVCAPRECLTVDFQTAFGDIEICVALYECYKVGVGLRIAALHRKGMEVEAIPEAELADFLHSCGDNHVVQPVTLPENAALQDAQALG